MNKKYNSIITAIILLVAALVAFILPGFEENVTDLEDKNSIAAVYFLDVGQADAALIKTKNNKIILVDGASNESETKYLSYLSALEVKTIDAMVISHPHSDHMGALDKVILKYDVKRIYMNTESVASPSYEDLLNAIRKKQVPVTEAKKGVAFEIDGANFSFLYPIDTCFSDTNANSAVMIADVYGKKFLFTGDRENLTSKDILSSLQKIDVLKVGHHGSNGSIRTKAMKVLLPDYAVISVGENNSYGHPTKSTISSLKKLGITAYRTDLDGTTVFSIMENGTMNVRTSKQRSETK